MMRWPTLVVLAALIAGLVIVDRTADGGSADGEDARLPTGSVRAVGDPEGSTWYCPGGFTTPDASNDHIVVLTNPTDAAVTGSLTIFPSLINVAGNPIPFERAVQRVDMAPNSQQEISLAPIVASLDPELARNTGSFVGALAEFGDSGMIVEHVMRSTVGTDSAACSTIASSTWWFASGTTTNGVTSQIYLLNPFPDDAVVDIEFLTDGGVREPSSLTGRLIPAQSLSMIDVSPVVPVWEQVTTQITARTGRVIAERLQVFADEAGPVGLSLTAGAGQLADQWFFPAGGAIGGAGESYVIYNPNDDAAAVEFELKPDSADRAGDLAPLPVRIGANERWVVDVRLHATHPSETLASLDATRVALPGEGYFVSVRSFNGVPVVVERIITRPLDVARGVTASMGVTVGSTEHTLSIAPWRDEAVVAPFDGELAVFNPAGNTISRVEIWVGDELGALTFRNQIELAPRRRAAFDLTPLIEDGDLWIRIESSTPTMAEVIAIEPTAVISATAIPSAGTVSIPDLVVFD